MSLLWAIVICSERRDLLYLQKEGILLANLFPRATAAMAALDFPGSWIFDNGIGEAQFTALGGSPTVTHEPGLSTAYENRGAIFRRVSEGFLRQVRTV
jgi:hypothetical protein